VGEAIGPLDVLGLARKEVVSFFKTVDFYKHARGELGGTTRRSGRIRVGVTNEWRGGKHTLSLRFASIA